MEHSEPEHRPWWTDWTPLGVLISSLVLTVAATIFVAHTNAARERARFAGSAQQTRERMRARFEALIGVLLAQAGPLSARLPETAAEFHAFSDRLELDTRFRGVQGVGISLRLNAQERQAWESGQRAGNGGFRVWPDHARSEYHSIAFLVPPDRRNLAAIGYDMFTEPVRRDAMERARDTGKPARSGTVQLVQEIDSDRQPGFLIYVPFYRGGSVPASLEERRDKLLGYVYSPLRTTDLFNSVVEEARDTPISFTVTDAVDRAPLFGTAPESAAYTSRSTLEIAGRPLTIVFYSGDELGGWSSLWPSLLLGGVGLALSALAYSLAGATRRAQLRAERSQAQERVLAEATTLLSSSLDYEVTLERIAQLLVPAWGDWCAIELVQSHEPLRSQQVAVAHQDPLRAEFAGRIRERFPLDLSRTHALTRVITRGEPVLVPPLTDARLAAHSSGPEHLQLLQQLKIRSGMIVPIKVKDRVAGAISILAAESERTYAESDLLIASELARRAGIAIENARLYREAQLAIRRRDDFLSVASHELKTPLAAADLQLAGLLQRLAREPLPSEELTRRLTRAKALLARLSALINELLDVSRVAAGRMTIQPRHTDLSALVQEVLARFEEAAKHAGCELDAQVEPELHGHWDPERIDQVLTNLIANAIKYAPRRPIELRLRHEGDAAVFSVRDYGIGIKPEDQARIFERFERAVPVRNYGGLGLGLWISRQIVEAHAGRIAVESSPGEGSTFTVTLPGALKS